jgi:hypothetical protein
MRGRPDQRDVLPRITTAQQREICWLAEIRDDAEGAEIVRDPEAVYPMKVEGM